MPATLSGSAEALVERFDVALLDLDGVVYVGPDAVSGRPGGAWPRLEAGECGWPSSRTTRLGRRKRWPSISASSVSRPSLAK